MLPFPQSALIDLVLFADFHLADCTTLFDDLLFETQGVRFSGFSTVGVGDRCSRSRSAG